MRQRVEFGIGSGIQALPRRTQHNASCRIKDEEVERQRPRELVEQPGAMRLATHHFACLRPPLTKQHRIAHHARGVHHAAQRRHRAGDFVQYRRHTLVVASVSRDHPHRRPKLFEFLDLPARGHAGRMAAGQHQMPRTGRHEPGRSLQPQGAEPAGDPVGCRSSDRNGVGCFKRRIGRDAKDNFADVARLRHMPHRLADTCQGKYGNRQRPQRIVRKRRQQRVIDRAQQVVICLCQLAKVVRVIGDIGPDRRDVRRRPDAPLAQFQEPPVSAECTEASRNEFASQRIQHDVDTLAAGRRQDFVSEGERARVHYMRYAQPAQHIALRR